MENKLISILIFALILALITIVDLVKDSKKKNLHIDYLIKIIQNIQNGK